MAVCNLCLFLYVSYVGLHTVLAAFAEHTHIMFSYYVHLILLRILSYNFASGRVITSCIKNDETRD